MTFADKVRYHGLMQTNETMLTATLSVTEWAIVHDALNVAAYRARQEEREAVKSLASAKSTHADNGLICRECEQIETNKVRAAREAMQYEVVNTKMLTQTHI